MTGSAWWQLLRAGNVFTAISNILAGFLLARGEWQPVLPLLFLILSSAMLYLAGMVLNDVFDLEEDRIHRPERPLPSGRIDPQLAKIVGLGFLVDGLFFAGIAGWFLESWLPVVVAVSLAAAIVAYDAWLKNTPFGPLSMGMCRVLNVLLGASAATHLPEGNAVYLYASAIGVYTVGLTMFARNESGFASNESGQSQKRDLLIAEVVIFLGLALVMALPESLSLAVPLLAWSMTAMVCGLLAVWPFFRVLAQPTPQNVQEYVSRLIVMFILLDALACAAVAGWPASLVVLALLVPTYIATRRAPMT